MFMHNPQPAGNSMYRYHIVVELPSAVFANSNTDANGSVPR